MLLLQSPGSTPRPTRGAEARMITLATPMVVGQASPSCGDSAGRTCECALVHSRVDQGTIEPRADPRAAFKSPQALDALSSWHPRPRPVSDVEV